MPVEVTDQMVSRAALAIERRLYPNSKDESGECLSMAREALSQALSVAGGGAVELPPITDRGRAGQIMDAAWPEFGGNHQTAEFWENFGAGVEFALKCVPSPSLAHGEAVAWTSEAQLNETRKGKTGLIFGRGDEFLNVPLYPAPQPSAHGEAEALDALASAYPGDPNGSIRAQISTHGEADWYLDPDDHIAMKAEDVAGQDTSDLIALYTHPAPQPSGPVVAQHRDEIERLAFPFYIRWTSGPNYETAFLCVEDGEPDMNDFAEVLFGQAHKFKVALSALTSGTPSPAQGPMDGAVPEGWKWKLVPDYPKGDVVGPCICGSWPGGPCLKCPPSAPQPSKTRSTSAEPEGWQWQTGAGDTWHTAERPSIADPETYARTMAGQFGKVRAIYTKACGVDG